MGDVGLFAYNFQSWPKVNADIPLDAFFGKGSITGARGVPSRVHFEVIVDSVHSMECVNIDFFFAVSLPDKVKVLILSHDFLMCLWDSIDD